MRVFILALLGLSSFAVAQSTTVPGDPLAESKRIDAEIAKLQETPPGKKMAAIIEKTKAAQENHNTIHSAIQEEMRTLRATEEVQQFEKKLQQLQSQRVDKWDVERKAIAEAGKRLYQTRHDEIAKLRSAALPQAKSLGLDVLDFPRVDGSTSAHPLNIIVASRILGVPYEWGYPEPTGSWWRPRPLLPVEAYLHNRNEMMRGSIYHDPRNDEFAIAAARAFASPSATDRRQDRIAKLINSVLVGSAGTHDAYVNLIEGKCDLNLTARDPSASESKLARDKGVELKLVPIARDALVFMVNTKNPIATLTSEQLRGIYKDKITRWKDVGEVVPAEGEDKILAFWRERDSGSRELFEALLMKGEVQPDPEGIHKPMLLSSGMGGPFSQLTDAQRGLAYSVYYYEHFMALSPHTKTIAVDGVEPTAETIASGKYPLVSPVYVAYRANQPADSPAMKLINWLRSPEGQAVIRESGYVPAR